MRKPTKVKSKPYSWCREWAEREGLQPHCGLANGAEDRPASVGGADVHWLQDARAVRRRRPPALGMIGPGKKLQRWAVWKVAGGRRPCVRLDLCGFALHQQCIGCIQHFFSRDIHLRNFDFGVLVILLTWLQPAFGPERENLASNRNDSNLYKSHTKIGHLSALARFSRPTCPSVEDISKFFSAVTSQCRKR